MFCSECGKIVPRGRKLSHTCSFKCGRKKRIRLNTNLKRRRGAMMKQPPQLTKKAAEKFKILFGSIFREEK